MPRRITPPIQNCILSKSRHWQKDTMSHAKPSITYTRHMAP